MLLLCSFLTLLVVAYVFFDVNYFLRAMFIVLFCRLFETQCSLTDITTVYGICTLHDCDVTFSTIRLCRIIRDLDFARYHFYLRTGIQRRSRELNIKSLQGCTLTVTLDGVPLFAPYKIESELVYWDDKSLFFEHKLVTLLDGKVRALLVSRQHAIRDGAGGVGSGNSTEVLLRGLPGFESHQDCPDYFKKWFKSMTISSSKLRAGISM